MWQVVTLYRGRLGAAEYVEDEDEFHTVEEARERKKLKEQERKNPNFTYSVRLKPKDLVPKGDFKSWPADGVTISRV